MDVSLESSSRKSSYLLSLQGLDVSSSTCVRSVLHSPLPNTKKLRYIGIDDFAGKKGCYYYSIVVDLITGKPVDVLSHRNGTVVKEWLKEHPQLLVISRDRARCFAQPIEETLPQVTQICDRFHLLKNLSEQVIKEVKRIAKGKRIEIEQKKFELPTNEYILESLRKKLFFLGEGPHVNKVQRYIRIHELLGKGYKTRQIAEDIGVKSTLVYRYTHVEKLDNFLSIEQRTLLKHMEAIARLISHGVIDSQEIAERIDGKVKKEWIARLTIDIRNEFKTRMCEIRSTSKQIKNSKNKIPSKEIFKSFFQEAYKTNNLLLQVILQKEPVRKMADICKKFKIMINRRNDSISLRKWIDNASNSGMRVLRDFAIGIQREYDAVQAAIDFQWSNGVVEGNVNRIKNLKRQMYGRASLPLLKRKIILAKFG